MSKRKDQYQVYPRGAESGFVVAADNVRREAATFVAGTTQVTDDWLIFEIEGSEVYRWRVSQLDGWCRSVRVEDIT
jgi:hypothetical protein